MSAAEAEALLHSITASTATAEKEKQVVTGIVDQVSSKAAVRCNSGLRMSDIQTRTVLKRRVSDMQLGCWLFLYGLH